MLGVRRGVLCPATCMIDLLMKRKPRLSNEEDNSWFLFYEIGEFTSILILSPSG